MRPGAQMHHFNSDLKSKIGTESVFDPLGMQRTVGIFGCGDHVEAQRPTAIVRILLQEMLCGTQQLILFARGDGFRDAAEPAIAAETHLHDDQRFSLVHDQIQFALRATVIARPQLEARPAQQLQGLVFGTPTGGEMRRQAHGAVPGAPVGTGGGGTTGASNCGVPLLKVAQSSRR